MRNILETLDDALETLSQNNGEYGQGRVGATNFSFICSVKSSLRDNFLNKLVFAVYAIEFCIFLLKINFNYFQD